MHKKAMSFARRQAIANVRLEGLPVTPKLLSVYQRHMDGEIDMTEALALLGIRRLFEFEILVQLPSKSEDILNEGIQQLDRYCHDAHRSIGVLGRIGLRFEREDIRKESAIESALSDINIALNHPTVLEIQFKS